ncbi:adenosine kinase [Desulfonema ishimotonii]|uniref:Adenosine kinase n=1 Tax=Desulfonema ishimotonii TaxID=45657 RepID=A0A401G215_9BACT|nr:adenosine kinase [Desulfonema ishimotonii]GBC63272.1 adenosine kinase [Desulfonema ishimotonii]
MVEFDKEKRRITGIGSVLVDILVHETDAFVEKAEAVKGGMTYVSPDHIEQAISEASDPPVMVPGGAACNTIIGVGRLGGEARFVGKSGNGQLAGLFESNLAASNVEPVLLKSPSLTGRVLSIITPDAQRSMLTYLGASAEVRAQEITPQHFEGTGIALVEGYLVFNPEIMRAALSAAKDAGARVALDLSSFTVVEEARGFLDEIVDTYVDILIANEDEARAFTGCSDEAEALRVLGEKADVAVLKVGERGSFIASRGTVLSVPPEGNGAVVDTTGAGDLWASGFLYGMVSGYSLGESGALGSLCGYEVCRVVGANIPEEGWDRIRSALK